MAEEKKAEMKIRFTPELGYDYRDLFNIYASPEEVIIEFGNRHRVASDEATIFNRIVLSPPAAFKLQQSLLQTLKTMDEQVRKQMAQAGVPTGQ